ncbi:unnamed protein product [Lampetra planeri]
MRPPRCEGGTGEPCARVLVCTALGGDARRLGSSCTGNPRARIPSSGGGSGSSGSGSSSSSLQLKSGAELAANAAPHYPLPPRFARKAAPKPRDGC